MGEGYLILEVFVLVGEGGVVQVVGFLMILWEILVKVGKGGIMLIVGVKVVLRGMTESPRMVMGGVRTVPPLQRSHSRELQG